MDRPEGPPRIGAHARKTARLEAWEEAGIAGKVGGKRLGAFVYEKAGNKFKVKVFTLQVTKVANRWPESKKRKRRWLAYREAKRRISRIPICASSSPPPRPRPPEQVPLRRVVSPARAVGLLRFLCNGSASTSPTAIP